MHRIKKAALGTGASSDIGAIIVRDLLEAEYIVYAQINKTPWPLDELASHPDLEIISHDLSTSQQAELLIKKIISKTNNLDVLVNSIGPFGYKKLSELTPQEWDEQMHFNVNLVFYLIHYAQEYLIKSQGHVINFTFAGVHNLKSWPNSTAFCAAKVALVVLTKSWASLMAPHKVRVNAISPGLIESAVSQSEERKKMSEEIPYGRPGTPDEVSQVLLWLLKSSPSYLTGAFIPVAGAWEYL